MFQALERKRSRTVVQPVLALIVHAGLISLALRETTAVPVHRDPGTPIDLFVLPASAPTLPGSGSGAGTEAVIPVSVSIAMPNLPPLQTSTVAVPLHQPGSFDPRRLLSVGAPPDSQVPGLGVLTESDLTDPPRALHLAEPRYPDALRQAGIEGAVTVTYVVDAAGFVEPPSIRIVSSDYPAFAAAVVEAVGKAQFIPGRVRGRAVRVLVRQIIRFATR